MLRISTFCMVAVVLAVGSSAVQAQDKPGATAKAAKPAVKLANATRPGKAFCPIMKHDFDVKANSPRASYKGKDYAMCCAGCKPEFEKTPAKYVAEVNAELKKSQKDAKKATKKAGA